MKKCDIIQDLLPLYKDEVVSASSIEMIEEHLKTCENCRNEFAKLQSEVKVRFNPAQKAEVGALKFFKKKLFRKNALVALVSVVLSIAILVSVGNYIFFHPTIIPYEKGLVSAEVHTVKVGKDKDGSTVIFTEQQTSGLSFEEKYALDVSCSKNTYCINTMGRDFEENGQRVWVVYINFSKTISTEWDKSDGSNKVARIIEPQSDNKPIDRYEVYYLDSDVDETDVVDINEFKKFREKGTLVWSGSLE